MKDFLGVLCICHRNSRICIFAIEDFSLYYTQLKDIVVSVIIDETTKAFLLGLYQILLYFPPLNARGSFEICLGAIWVLSGLNHNRHLKLLFTMPSPNIKKK